MIRHELFIQIGIIEDRVLWQDERLVKILTDKEFTQILTIVLIRFWIEKKCKKDLKLFKKTIKNKKNDLI